MAVEPTGLSRRNWRDRESLAGPPRDSKAPGRWKNDAGAGSGQVITFSRNTRVIRAAAACLLGIGLIVSLILMIRPIQPASVLLIGADYATNLGVPHNVYGRAGLEGLREITVSREAHHLWGRSKLRRVNDAVITLDSATRWGEVLDGLRHHGFPGNTIVLFLALHAVTGPEGNVYLLPEGATKPTDGVELATIIDDLGTLPTNTSKVLILEGAQVSAAWHLGIGHNDFSRRLRQLDEHGAIAKVPGLWILSASDVDQRCWASDGLRRTVFAHYVIEGLRGAAAGDDRRVNLAELHQYVRQNVSDWVWAARGAVQEPILLPEKPVGREARNVVLALASERPAQGLPRSEPGRSAVADDGPEGSRLPKALEDRWREFERLAMLAPHPSAYAPRTWAAYRATLIRYEQLTRAGAAQATLGELTDELDRLRDHFESDRRERHRMLPLSAGNSLGLIALRGGTVGTPATPQLDRLWAASDPDFERAIAEYRRSATAGVDSGLSSVQTRAEGFLYKRAEDDPEANLAKVAMRLAQLQEPDVPLSAEAHFLTMLDQGRGHPSNEHRSSYWDRLRQALRVRRLAELAALGVAPGSVGSTPSEQLVPWIAPRVEQADELRRRGEDLLFATSESEWNDARVALNRAEATYKAAVARAGALRRAIATRDRAMADLPEYARWLADRASYDGVMIENVRDLLDRAHDLDRRLEQPSDDLDIMAINQQIDEFGAQMRAVEQAFGAERERVDTSRLAEDWESATAAAAVAPSHPDLLAMRRSLWRRLANIAVNDRKLVDSKPSGPADPSVPERRRGDRVRHLRRACVQLATAIAVLGRDLFDDRTLRAWNDSGSGKFGTDVSAARDADFEVLAGQLGELRDRLSQPVPSEAALRSILEPGRGDGWGVLSRAGEQVGQRWRGLGSVIDRLLAHGDLALAGRYGRRVDGTAPARLRSEAEPSSLYRDVQIGDVLAWLAERTWTDHWYDRKPQDTPYYRVAGSRYLADLDQIVRSHGAKVGRTTPGERGKGGWPRMPESVRLLYQQKDQLGFDEPGAIVLTTERSYRVSYRLTGMAPELAGVPVVWAEPESSSLLRLEGPGEGQRVAWEQGGENRSPQTIGFQISCPILDDAAAKLTRPSVQRTALAVRGNFRGQQFERRTHVLVQPVPDTTAMVPPHHGHTASIAIRADQEVFERYGEGRGAIAIVLDCSGSMGKPEVGTKFHDARKALTTILRTMPRGTTISVWAFGFENRGYLRHDPIAVENNNNPERTIRRILGPVRWDPSQVVVLDQALDRIEPVHGTPLVRAMVKAAEDLDHATGFKTMLVLTDGKDTRFARDAVGNPGKLSIPAFLAKRFGHAGIAIHMVAFKIEDGELAEARSQFAGALEQLDPPGHFIAVGESSRLVSVLRHSLRSGLVCQLDGMDGRQPIAIEVAHPDEPDHWLLSGLQPGRYTLKVRADRPSMKGVELEPGDRMIVRLALQSDGTLSFQRTLFSDGFPTKRPFAEGRGWRLAVLQNRHIPESNRLQMQAALEPLDTTGPYLSLHKPGLTWFELKPRTAATPFAVQWRPQIPSPAPLWSINVPEWPAIDENQGPDWPTLRVWWHPDAHRSMTMVQRGEQFQTPAGISHLKVLTREGDTVTIESVQVELHHVEMRPGEAREPIPCLVVRLEHPAGKPYWIDPRSLADLEIAGHEHRYFAGVGKYTGLFWPVTQSRMDAALKNLGLVSVAQLRRDAEDHGRHLELQLGPPRADDPPVELPVVNESTDAPDSALELRLPLPIPD